MKLARFVLAPAAALLLCGMSVPAVSAMQSTPYAKSADEDGVVNAYWLPGERDLVVSEPTSRHVVSGEGRVVSVDFEVSSAGAVVSRTVNHSRPLAADGSPVTQWSAGTEGVWLDWSETIPEEIEWTVTRDKEIVYVGLETTFTDLLGDRTVQHDYRITGFVESVDDEGETQFAPVFYQITIPASDFSSLGLPVQSALDVRHNTDITSRIAPVNYNVINRSFVYNTFISPEVTETPLACVEQHLNGGVWTGGDNRGFLTARPGVGQTSRTSVYVPIDFFGLAGAEVNTRYNTISKVVGYTHSYDANGIPVESAQASASGIALAYIQNTDAYGERYVEHSMINPLCMGAPAIDYQVNFSSNVDGWMSVSGYHDQAPHHEVLWEASDNALSSPSNSGCWYRSTNKGFEWLFGFPTSPLWPQAHIDLDANPILAAPSCPVV
ncbi:MAG: DUF3238 domain-containing protein [Salinibacterium sp.]|nr:DUF3238 domain-containing protein [Salinibacterium sp.]MBF0671557.1 DUF3238 domain-containing protein [Salinibacterium sp.]